MQHIQEMQPLRRHLLMSIADYSLCTHAAALDQQEHSIVTIYSSDTTPNRPSSLEMGTIIKVLRLRPCATAAAHIQQSDIHAACCQKHNIAKQ